MEKSLLEIIIIATGCAVIIFRKRFVHDSLVFQNKAFGFRFGKNEVKASERVVLLCGLVAIGMAILSLLGINERR